MRGPTPTADTPNGGAGDVRPIVARPSMGPSGLAIGIGIALAALLLFALLESRRRALRAPATFPIVTQADLSRSPPPLYIPPAPPEPTFAAPPVPATATLPVPPQSPRLAQPAPALPPQVLHTQPAPQRPVQPAPPRNAGGAAIVIDNSQPRIGAVAPVNPGTTASSWVPGVATDRTRSGMLANRAETVSQGTLIQAVLETAFDSTSPGFARALVQRDVRGFDGSRVLIPRGSRLIGEYRSDTGAGQKRVMIVWARLIRPDGVTMALASPTTDPVGRGGVRAQVDSHFWERFGSAFLQSTLDLGVALAARNSSSPVIIAGSVTGASGTILPRPTTIPPTLKVVAGSSISVFVARDLDFSGAPEAR